MRTLHIETGRHLYGGAEQVGYLLRELSRNPDWPAELVCPRDSELLERVRDLPVYCHPLPLRGDLDPSFFARLAGLIRRRKPDVVHVHSRRGADVWGGLAARACRVPAVVTRRVDNPEAALAARAKYGLYARVAVISEAIRNVLLREGVPEHKLVCIPSAVDSDKYKGECDREAFLEELDLKPEHRAVGMIAQFIRRKGHDDLLRALPEILKRCPEARIVFFGRGPLEEQIRERVEQSGMTHAVRFAGFRDDLHRLLPCLDLAVHPAHMEGLGVSLLQAAAAGVPLVGYEAGGVPEIVRNGESGRLVSCGDVQGLADAAAGLLTDPERALALGRGGRALVERDFSVPAMTRSYKELYREVAGNNG